MNKIKILSYIINKKKNKIMQVHLNISLHLKYGDALYLIGNIPEMGNWNPQNDLDRCIYLKFYLLEWCLDYDNIG